MNGPVNIERPNSKWTFVKFSKIQVKVVLDSGQAMLVTGQLLLRLPAQPWSRPLNGDAGPF